MNTAFRTGRASDQPALSRTALRGVVMVVAVLALGVGSWLVLQGREQSRTTARPPTSSRVSEPEPTIPPSTSVSDPSLPTQTSTSAVNPTSSSPSRTSSSPASTTSVPTRTTSPPSAGWLSVLTSDVVGSHDATPRGVPDGYDWQHRAVPATDPALLSQWGGINMWGQVFATTSGTTNFAVRLQARDAQLWFLRPSGWRRATIPSGSLGALEGAYWSGSFKPDANSPATSRSEGAGVYSTSLQGLASGQRDVFHFWWEGLYPRIPIPKDASAAVVRVQLRLTPEQPGGSLSGARFIASVSGDLYATVNTKIAPGGINPAISQSRMKWVTGSWQDFFASTMSPDQLRANPPPLG